MEVYECIECKKMTEGFPATLRRKCLVCRNTELEMRYRKRKFESFTKKELADRHKQLIEKLRDEDDYSDGFSEVDDNPKDEDFIPTTPAPQRSSKRNCLIFRKNKIINDKKKRKEIKITAQMRIRFRTQNRDQHRSTLRWKVTMMRHEPL